MARDQQQGLGWCQGSGLPSWDAPARPGLRAPPTHRAAPSRPRGSSPHLLVSLTGRQRGQAAGRACGMHGCWRCWERPRAWGPQDHGGGGRGRDALRPEASSVGLRRPVRFVRKRSGRCPAGAALRGGRHGVGCGVRLQGPPPGAGRRPLGWGARGAAGSSTPGSGRGGSVNWGPGGGAQDPVVGVGSEVSLAPLLLGRWKLDPQKHC